MRDVRGYGCVVEVKCFDESASISAVNIFVRPSFGGDLRKTTGRCRDPNNRRK